VSVKFGLLGLASSDGSGLDQLNSLLDDCMMIACLRLSCEQFELQQHVV